MRLHRCYHQVPKLGLDEPHCLIDELTESVTLGTLGTPNSSNNIPPHNRKRYAFPEGHGLDRPRAAATRHTVLVCIPGLSPFRGLTALHMVDSSSFSAVFVGVRLVVASVVAGAGASFFADRPPRLAVGASSVGSLAFRVLSSSSLVYSSILSKRSVTVRTGFRASLLGRGAFGAPRLLCL